MSFCAAKPGAEEVLRTLPRDSDTGGPTAEADDVHVVVLHALASRKVIVTKRGTDAHDLIGSNGSSYAASANKNAPIYFAGRYSARQGDCKIRIVVIRFMAMVAKVDDFVTLVRQQLCQLLLHCKSSVVRSDTNPHPVLPTHAAGVLFTSFLAALRQIIPTGAATSIR